MDGLIARLQIDQEMAAAQRAANQTVGQGAARAIIEEFIQCATMGRPHGKLLAQARDFLAARQPVAAAVKDCLTGDGGPLVGREPVTDAGRTVAYDAIDRFLRNNMDDAAYAEYVEHLEALWAAVPEQSVDLGQFRKAVMVYRNFSRSNEAESDRLLALIDGQA